MTGVTITASARRTPGSVIWGLICLIIAVLGFRPSYFGPVMSGTFAHAVAHIITRTKG